MEKELAALNEDFTKLKDAFHRSVSYLEENSFSVSCSAVNCCCVFLCQVRSKASGGGRTAGGFDSGEE